MGIEEIKHVIMPKIKDKMNQLFILSNDIDKNKIAQKISQYIKQIKIKIDKLIDSKKEVSDNNNVNLAHNNQKYFINKIINRINNKNLKKNIIVFLNDNCEKIIYDFNTQYDVITRSLNNIHLTNLKKLSNMTEHIYEITMDLYVLFIDCFLLRRILDKKYIENSIIYTGMLHSINYIFFLVKYYNFKIIKINHIEGNKKDLLKDISNTNYLNDIYKYFFSNNVNYTQCLLYDGIIGEIYK